MLGKKKYKCDFGCGRKVKNPGSMCRKCWKTFNKIKDWDKFYEQGK